MKCNTFLIELKLTTILSIKGIAFMRRFSQLSYQERRKIYIELRNQKSINDIAKTLERTTSTISREIKRNSDRFGYLYAEEAHRAALNRKHIHAPKIDTQQNLQGFIEEKLRLRWSPDAIAGSWSLANPEQSICKETIYQWLYSSNEPKKLELRKLLVRTHKKRGLKPKQRRSKIKNRVSIHERPDHISQRSEVGHYECDLVFNSGSASKNVCTLIERVTRKSIIIRNNDKSTKTVIDAIIQYIARENLVVKSITFDNGTEFASHTKFNELGIKTYFCDPGTPYQKGSIEHFNGMIRRYIPFDLDADSVTEEYVIQVSFMMNTMPRKILGYKTPMQIFEQMTSNLDVFSESRVKLARPAIEANLFNQENSCVAFHS